MSGIDRMLWLLGPVLYPIVMLWILVVWIALGIAQFINYIHPEDR
jgi:hypothetical protein